jgi:hypothetical protein
MKHVSATIRATILLAALGGLEACSGSDDEKNTAEALLTELNAQASIICDCYDVLGYSSRSACEDSYGHLPSERQCIIEAFDRDKAGAKTFLDCIVPHERTYTSCVSNRLRCDDPSGLNACLDDYRIGTRNCIDLPPAIARAIDDCYR